MPWTIKPYASGWSALINIQIVFVTEQKTINNLLIPLNDSWVYNDIQSHTDTIS